MDSSDMPADFSVAKLFIELAAISDGHSGSQP